MCFVSLEFELLCNVQACYPELMLCIQNTNYKGSRFLFLWIKSVHCDGLLYLELSVCCMDINFAPTIIDVGVNFLMYSGEGVGAIPRVPLNSAKVLATNDIRVWQGLPKLRNCAPKL